MVRLVGPGGSGKTTTGALLAARLGVSFVDLDRCFSERVGDIGEFIKEHGYHNYARENIENYCWLLLQENRPGVMALSSGFMTYEPNAHPQYSRVRSEVELCPNTFALLPSFDREVCVFETVRRQIARPFARSGSKEEVVIRARFAVYMAMPVRKVETMRPARAVVDELVAALGAENHEFSTPNGLIPSAHGEEWMPENDPWFESIGADTALSHSELRTLQEDGFVVTRGPVPTADLTGLARAYDSAVLQADPADVKEGSTTTRVQDFANRGPEFDGLYLHAQLLEACCKIIKEPFRLSSVLARTLNPGKVPKRLHVDFPNDDAGWPMVGFIFMIDTFRPENGATCFLPGSQGMTTAPDSFDGVVPACGPAGSMLIYNGSVWHEHGPNLTDSPRRSIQGALIRRTEKPAIDWQTRMRPETLSRLSPLAMYLLGL